MSPNEGKIINIDASASSDVDGDALTFTWSQISGPAVTLPTESEAVIEVVAPEVSADDTVVLQLGVSDDEGTVTENVSFDVVNISQLPTITTDYFHNEDFETSLTIVDMAGRVTNSSKTVILAERDGLYEVRLGSLNGQDEFIFEGNILASFDHEVKISKHNGGVLIEDEVENKILVLNSVGDETAAIMIDEPCSIDFISSTPEQSSVTHNFMVVGKRSGGGAVYRVTNSDDQSVEEFEHYSDFDGGESLCHLESVGFYVDRDIVFNDAFVEITPRFTKFLGFDEKTDTILLFDVEIDEQGELSIDLIDEQSAQINLAENEFADFVFAKTSARGLGLAFSNGQTEGTHRFIAVGVASDDKILQETHQWSYGTPIDMVVSSPHYFTSDEIVILAKDSPQAIVFRGSNYPDDYGDSEGAFFPTRGPEYLEVGFGADRLIGALDFNNRLSGVLISYPEKQKVKFLAADWDKFSPT